MSDARSIWKFPLAITELTVVSMPVGSDVLSVQVQHGEACIWVAVDVNAPKVERRFCWRGTGHPLGDVGRFVGTIQVDGGHLVFHLFEAPPSHPPGPSLAAPPAAEAGAGDGGNDGGGT